MVGCKAAFLPTSVKSGHKNQITLKNTRINPFAPDNVIILHGKHELVIGKGENGLIKSRQFIVTWDYFTEHFLLVK